MARKTGIMETCKIYDCINDTTLAGLEKLSGANDAPYGLFAMIVLFGEKQAVCTTKMRGAVNAANLEKVEGLGMKKALHLLKRHQYANTETVKEVE